MSSSIQLFSLHFRNPTHPPVRISAKPPPSPPFSVTRRLHISSKLPTNPIQTGKGLLQRVAISVIGGCIVLGSFGWTAKPVLAAPVKSSENREIYKMLLKKGPKNVEDLKVLLYAKIRKEEHKDALKFVQKLISMEPGEVEWRFMEAICYEMMRRFDKAKRVYHDILKDDPLHLTALHGLAMAMHMNKEYAAMFGMLNKAAEIACRENRVTEERDIKILIAQMHVVKGDLEEALKKYQLLIDENPRDFRPYLCQGIIYSLLDKKKEADEQFETYQSLVPEEFPQRGFIDDLVLEAKSVCRPDIPKEPQLQHHK